MKHRITLKTPGKTPAQLLCLLMTTKRVDWNPNTSRQNLLTNRLRSVGTQTIATEDCSITGVQQPSGTTGESIKLK